MYFSYSRTIRQTGHRMRRQQLAGAVPGFNFLGDALRDQFDRRTRLEMGL